MTARHLPVRRAGLFRRLWHPTKMLVSRLWGPRVVWGYVGHRGEYLANTRISNQCSISGRQSLEIEDHVFIGNFCVLDASAGLKIEEGTQVAALSGIYTHSSHVAVRLYGRDYARSESKEAYFKAPVRIGAYSFIGTHVVILPGTVLGQGCLVTAQSVVRGDFPAFSIISGNPAKRVGDTRALDRKFLVAHPDLQSSYDRWAAANDPNDPA